MAIEKVRDYLKQYGREKDIKEFEASSATVELAAKAVGVEPARIAKTLSFCGKEEGSCILVVTAGDRKVDNSKFKHFFGMKAKMPKGEEVEALTGHAIGGVCPFANPAGASVYLDESLKRFDTVFPAAGSANSAIELTCEELFALSRAREWVDVCKEV
ncbi:MAG TPA: YbaK/EbsC family protein [Candidatus Scatomonas pullistercoris]|uniref:YbaK/EbsC family protein n=1 Tax=Candidatus Scatomonas pullistercoris TaxID=2840920 RepID=A0A9D1TA40_9FIRM|nr:YbaK/EbsC family protein [Candidatus Scatomonas pullistercoris]